MPDEHATAIKQECKAKHVEHNAKFVDLLYTKQWWCCASPCTCGGIGCLPFGTEPYCIMQQKCCCIEHVVQTDSIYGDSSKEGSCVDLRKLGCLVTHCTCPPWCWWADDRGIPGCACADYRCGLSKTGRENPFTEGAKLLAKTYLVCYCCCVGLGFGEVGDPLFMNLMKCFCIRDQCYTDEPCPHGEDWCFAYSKFCCCMNAFTFPSLGGEKDGIPGCACLGKLICCAPVDYSEAKKINSNA